MDAFPFDTKLYGLPENNNNVYYGGSYIGKAFNGFTLPAGTRHSLAICVKGGYNCDNVIVRPMLVPATIPSNQVNFELQSMTNRKLTRYIGESVGMKTYVVTKGGDPIYVDLFNLAQYNSSEPNNILIFSFHPYFVKSGLYVTGLSYTSIVTTLIEHPSLEITKVLVNNHWNLVLSYDPEATDNGTFVTIIYKQKLVY